MTLDIPPSNNRDRCTPPDANGNGEGNALDQKELSIPPDQREAELRYRLAEAEDALRAIREGEVDAILVEAPDGIQVHSLVDHHWPRRIFRWTIGALMLAGAGWFGGATLLNRASVRATITAPLVAVRVPRQGLVQGTPPAVGAAVAAGEHLFDVQPPSADDRPANQLRAESESIRRTALALRTQLRELDKLKEAFSEHFNHYRDIRIHLAESLAAEREARVHSAVSNLKTAELELRALKHLSLRGSSGVFELSRAEQSLERSRHELEMTRQATARSQIQLEAARNGLFVGETDGGQDRVASRQRGDEIEIQQTAVRARLSELEGKLDELKARLESEGQYVAGHHSLAVIAPVSGVVWSSTVSRSSEVSPGSTALEILDPSQLIIEAAFNKSEADRVRPGDPIQARLIGASRTLSGRVVRVVGTSASDQGPIGVAARVPTSFETFRAIIKLDEQPEGGTAANHYHVGRSAIVWVAH